MERIGVTDNLPRMAVAALVVSVLAFLASASAAWSTRQSTREVRRQADSAEAQSGYAEQQVEYARKMFELEKDRADREKYDDAVHRLVQTRVAKLPKPPPWHVGWSGKQGFMLQNASARALFSVSLTFDVEPARIDQREWARVDEHAIVRVQLVRAFGASPSTVTVHWKDEEAGEVRAWTTALP